MSVHSKQTRVLVVSDVRLYREGIAATLDRRETIAIAGTAGNNEETLLKVQSLHPDVVVLDIAMKGSLETVQALSQLAVATKIIAFGVEEREAEVFPYAEAGVAGYVPCEASIEEFVSTIETVARGELRCSPRITAMLFQRLAELARGRSTGVRDPILTGRERQILTLIRDGLSNKEIAQGLNIEVATVKNHVHNLLSKLNLTSRNQAAATQFTLTSSDRRMRSRFADASPGIVR